MAEATVLYFDPSGKFQRDDCWLIMKAGHINESDGDPHVWYSGQWQPALVVEESKSLQTARNISPEAYIQGLVWAAANTHPPGAKQPGYGSWALPPLSTR